MPARIAVLAGVACCLLVSFVGAQQRLELSVPGSDIVSHAVRTDERLRIVDDMGRLTVYVRDARYDSADGRFLGYASGPARQILRWPVVDRGRFQIADAANPTAFRASQMEIRPADRRAPGLDFDQRLDPEASYRFTTRALEDRGITLSANAAGALSMQPLADAAAAQAWHLTALPNGYYRLHSHARGRRWSLAGLPAGAVQLVRTTQEFHQLWQLTPVPGAPGYFALVNAGGGLQELVLTVAPTGQVLLEPFAFAPGQLWRPLHFGGLLPPIFAEYRFAAREIRPHAPLEPARVELVNSCRQELWVLIADRWQPDQSLRVKIPAGQNETILLQRDAGGTLVEVYEQVLPGGLVQREEFATPLPPTARYDVSVYELAAQSIAIDRTVPGGKIEDVTYSPKSIGWFELPAGESLPDGTLDVYAQAKAQGNPGQVRRIDPQQWQPQVEQKDMVEELLDQLQKKDPP